MVRYDKFYSLQAKSMRASEIRELLKLVEKGDVISLAGGLPDPQTFPREELADIARRVILEYGEKVLQYAPTRGVAYFLESVRKFSERYGVKVADSDGIIATVGSQQALYLIGMALLSAGDIVVTEEPTYLAAIQAFSSFGARFASVPIDEDGMRVDKLEEVLARLKSQGLIDRVKFVYTIASCHNPAGTTMPDERRKHLLELAEQYDLLIVEDDPYRFIMFEEANATPIKTLDKTGRTIYLGTVSKILAPGLRLGWAIGPEPIIEKLELVKQPVDLHTPTLSQYIAAEALKAGVVDRHLPRIRALYKEKRDAMLSALVEYMPENVKWTRPVGGMFVWVWFPEHVNARELLKKAIEKGVAFVPGDAFYPNGGGVNTARLNFSYPPPDKLREGVRRLAEAYKQLYGG